MHSKDRIVTYITKSGGMRREIRPNDCPKKARLVDQILGLIPFDPPKEKPVEKKRSRFAKFRRPWSE